MSRPVPPRRLRHLRPPAQHLGRLVERVGRIARHHAEVGQGQGRRPAGGEAAQRVEGQVEVEVGRRGGRPQHPDVGQAHPDRVADEQDARLRVVQAEVVLGVAGRVDRGEGPGRADHHLVAVAQDLDAIGRASGARRP